MSGGTRWLDDREARAWRGFVRLGAEVHGHLNRQLVRDTGLSESDYAVLVALSEAPGGRLRARELGRLLGWEKSRLSHHVTRMQKRGLVDRAECPTDARGAFVHISRAGADAIERAAPGHVEEVRRTFVDLLTPAQVDMLIEVADTVLGALATRSAALCDEPPCDGPAADACAEAEPA